jgi:hypothetical protein
MAEPIEVDYENMTSEQADKVLREHGYDPKLVGKYYALIAESTILRQERDLLREEMTGIAHLEDNMYPGVDMAMMAVNIAKRALSGTFETRLASKGD